jgi:hypothetical protein
LFWAIAAGLVYSGIEARVVAFAEADFDEEVYKYYKAVRLL